MHPLLLQYLSKYIYWRVTFDTHAVPRFYWTHNWCSSTSQQSWLKCWNAGTTIEQSQKNHGSVVALLSGKFLQIRKVFATRHMFSQNWPVGKETVWMVRNCLDNPQTVRTIWKLFEQSKNCPYNPETFWTTQKLSGQSRNCTDNPETFWTTQNLSGQFKNCPDNIETVQKIKKLSGQPKNCPDNIETVWTI